MSGVLVGRRGVVIPVAELGLCMTGTMRALDAIAAEVDDVVEVAS